MYVLKKYGTATTILFPLVDFGATDFESTPVTIAAGDAQISKDEGAFGNTSNNFAHEGNGIYSLALTATEMQAATVVITVIDQTATKEWEDQAIVIDTYGNASGEHGFDLDVATQAVNVTQVSGDSTAADNLELDYDGTGYAKANSTIGTVTSLSAAAIAAIWDEVLTGATHNVTNSAGRRLREIASNVVHTGTAQGPGTGSNQIQLDAGASAVDDTYDPAVICIVSGTGEGQCRQILQYDGTTKTATVGRDWKVNPDATSEFIVSGNPGHEHVNEGLVTAATSTTVDLNALASSVDDAYNHQVVFIRSGTGADQARFVTDYDGTNQRATVHRAWDTTPDTTSAYVMLPIVTPLNLIAGASSGTRTITLHTQETDTTTVPTVKLTVMNAAEDAVITIGTTDTDGDVDVSLDDGTYDVRQHKAGYTGATTTITVTADATENLTINPIAAPASADPETCVASGKIVDITGTAVSGAAVIFTTRDKLPQATDNTDAYVSQSQTNTTTDASGDFSATLVRSATVYLSIPSAGITRSFTVPDAASVTLGTIMT